MVKVDSGPLGSRANHKKWGSVEVPITNGNPDFQVTCVMF